MFIRFMVSVAIALSSSVLVAQQPSTQPSSQPTAIRLLMVIGEPPYDALPLPAQLMERLGEDGIQVEIILGLTEINASKLAAYDAICFYNYTTDPLGDEQKQAIRNFLKVGKGLVCLHGALRSFPDWLAWRQIVGAQVTLHEPFQPFHVTVVDRSNPIATNVQNAFRAVNETYFVDERSEGMNVIAQTTANYEGRNAPEPIAWTHRFTGGRVFATTLRYNKKNKSAEPFSRLLSNGIQWVAGRLGPATMLSDREKAEGFEPLFNGKNLDGWKYDSQLWHVRNGIIVGNSHPKGLEVNSCAIYPQEFSDFILRYSVRFITGNTGVQFRSQELPNYEVAGYQEDVVPGGWGNLHEQNGRRRLVDGWTGKAEQAVNVKDWTDMEVMCQGPRIVLKSNGVVTADYTEAETDKPRSGIIAIQMHRGDPMEVQFTNIRIKTLK